MSLTDKAALKTWRFEQGAGFPFAPPVIEVTSAAGNGPALGSPSARSLLPFKTVPRRGTLFERTDLCQHRAPLRSPFGEPPPPKGEEEGRLTAAFRGSAGLPSGSAETAFVRAKHPTGVYLRGTRVQGISLLLSFSIAKRKKQSLSALRAAAMRRLRSETPLRRQKGSLRKGLPPSAEGGRGGIPPYGRERDLGSPTGASIACASLRDRSAPSAPPALTGRFASLRARGLRPTL